VELYKGLYSRGKWDEMVIDEVRWHYERGIEEAAPIKCLTDVGCHIGAFIRFVKEDFPDAEVVGIDPDPVSLGLAYINCGYLLGVKLLHNYVAYEQERTALFTVNGKGCDSMMYETGQKVKNFVEQPVQVEPLTLEEAIGDRQVDLLKMDCEHGEYDIIPHVKPSTWQQIKVIIGEYHGDGSKFKRLCEPVLRRFFKFSYIPPYNKHVGFFLGVKRSAN
jgi:FkbM family methyltransferase